MPPAENIKTMAVVLAVVGAFFLANHWDNDASLEWAASDAATAQANDVAHQQRIERAAQEMCGILQICHKRDQAFGRKLHPKALLSLNLYGKLIFSRFQGRAECAKCWRCTQWNPLP